MKVKQWDYIFDLLYERYHYLDERSEQEQLEAADPKGEELKFIEKTIEDLIYWHNQPAILKISRFLKCLDFFLF